MKNAKKRVTKRDLARKIGKFGISRSTLYEWESKGCPIAGAIKMIQSGDEAGGLDLIYAWAETFAPNWDWSRLCCL